MAAINGTDLTLFIPQIDASALPTAAWIPIGLAKSASLNISTDTPDISTKDSSAWTEVMAGMKSFTIDFEALVDLTTNTDASANNLKPLYDYFTNGRTIKVAFGKSGTYWYGDCIIASLEASAEAEQPVSYSGSLTGTGVLTYGTDSANPPTYPT
jgi:predicted secreted protein